MQSTKVLSSKKPSESNGIRVQVRHIRSHLLLKKMRPFQCLLNRLLPLFAVSSAWM